MSRDVYKNGQFRRHHFALVRIRFYLSTKVVYKSAIKINSGMVGFLGWRGN